MSKEVADALRATRAKISEPGTWIINRSHQFINGKMAYCLTGAISEGTVYWDQIVSLGNVLKRRFDLGLLPEPIYGPGGRHPFPWETYCLNRVSEAPTALTQFNNSTSQAAVLALLDEAIEAEDPPRKPGEEPEVTEPAEAEEPAVEDEEPNDEDDEGDEDGDDAAVQERELELA